jgi:pimeloyl-ACP methyl ester carboxylesterase
MPDIQYLDRGKDHPQIAYRFTSATQKHHTSPLIVFCGGFQSDMNGSKASFLEAQCASLGLAYLRFDYSGHGASGGEFVDGTISSWTQDTLDIIDNNSTRHNSEAGYIIVGSSMGGWIGLLIAQKRKGNLKGFVGIAAAPDFTDEIYNNRLDGEQRITLHETGQVEMESDYDAPYIVTERLVNDGRQNFLMPFHNAPPYVPDIPIRLLQGKKDAAVPWTHALAIQDMMPHSDVNVTLIDDGDHSLSRPEDLDILWNEILQLL